MISVHEGVLSSLKRYLEAEEQSEKIMKIPADTYSKLASHMQNLRRISSTDGEDLTSRLIRKQSRILQGMMNQLLRIRLEKATSSEARNNLLPEEKYVFGFQAEFMKRQSRFISAVMDGHPSFFAMAQKQEMSRKVTVCFLKPIGEIIGFDLKRYGPFKVHDLAIIPSGNAEVLIANGDALLV